MKKNLLFAMFLGLTVSMASAQDILVVDEFTGNASSGIGTAAPGPEYGAGQSVITYENDMLRSDYTWSNADWFPRAVYYHFNDYVNCAAKPVLMVKFMVTDNFNDNIPVRLDLYGEAIINDTVRQEVETNARPWELTATNGEWYEVSDNFIENNRFACTYWGGGIPETRIDSTRINGFEAFASYGNAAFNGQAGTLFIDYIKLSGPTGIEEYLYGKPAAFSLAVYPNPATEFVTVNAEKEIQSINVFDMLGKSVMTVNNVMTNKAEVKVNHLNPGLYFVAVEDLSGNTVSKKLHIKK